MKLRWLLIVGLILAPDISVCAHPLDISLTTLQVLPSGLSATTYIHPYELSLLAESQGLSLQETGILELRKILLAYFNEHFIIYSKKGMVYKESLVFEGEKLYQILAGGVYINYLIPIERDEYPITLEVDLFIEFFNTQTNKVILLDPSGQPFPGSREIYLTAKRTQWIFNLNHPDFSAEYDDLIDSDQDGMTDRMERLYGIDPGNPDTDADGYSDSIEFSFGWDPFDKKPSPGQSQEVVAQSTWSGALQEELPATESSRKSISQAEKATSGGTEGIQVTEAARPRDDSTKAAGTPVPQNLIEQHRISDRKITRSKFLEKVLARIDRLVQEGLTFTSMLTLLLSVFALGFLHASMPGHGKGILLSYLAQENRKFRHALGFVMTFTITHLIDVVALSFGFKFFSSTYQSARISQTLKFIGGAGLIVIAIYMIFSGIQDTKEKNSSRYQYAVAKKSPKRRGAVLLGFLTGLAPCPFGWAILMILLSLGKAELIPPIIAVFALGIFFFLLIVTLGVIFLRAIAMDLFSKFSRYSQLVSGVLLFAFGLLFFTPRIPTI